MARFHGILRDTTALSALWATALVASAAQAQSAVPDSDTTVAPVAQESVASVTQKAEAPPAAGDDVIVTGSRVARAGFTAPTPTTIVGIEQIQRAAPANIADYLNQLPQLVGSSSPRSQGLGSSNVTGANVLNLRNLGALRTLVLLDGRRIAPSVITGSVDINVLPQGLIERVDIVTGGASASWGSDAVAGVVNFVLNKKFSGLKLDAQVGVTEHGDAETFLATATYGTSFGGGRGQFMINGQYNKIGSGDVAGSRSWFNRSKVVTNPAYVAGNGQPQTVILPNVGLSQGTRGGLITAGPLRGTQFVGPNGTPAPFDFGFVSGQLSVGGTTEDFGETAPLQQPVESYSGFARVSYDVTDGITAYAEFMYGKSTANTISVPYMRFNNITIQRDNAYLDAVTRARLGTATNFTFGTTNENLGNTRFKLQRELMQGVVGLSGRFGDGWGWDAYYQHGQTDFLQVAGNNARTANYNLAIDAVVNPANGQIVCRSTFTNPTNGCVPYNVFGVREPTAEQRAYLLGDSIQPITFKEDIAAASLRGEPFSTWAGPVSIALGAEYRRESFVATSNSTSMVSVFYLGNYQPSNGKFDVKEGFFEAVVPLLKDLPFAKSLDFNGAIRRTDYSTSGVVTTWKLGGTWDIVDGLRVRTTRSRDIRAPNSAELFRNVAFAQGNYNDPQTGTTVSAQTVTRGNTGLFPEEADTFSAGVVVQPVFLPGFSVSVDYYKIKISDAITTATAQQTLDQCFAGVTALCGNIVRNTAGVLTQVIVQPTNVQDERERGVDIEASYRTRVSDTASISLRGLASYIASRRVTAFGSSFEYAGTNSDSTAIPHWRANVSATYTNLGFTGSLTSRFISGGIPTKIPPIVATDIPAIAYFDLYAAQKVGSNRNFELFFAIQNLLDRDPPPSPPVAASTNQISSGANGFLYDTLGRQFRIGARIGF